MKNTYYILYLFASLCLFAVTVFSTQYYLSLNMPDEGFLTAAVITDDTANNIETSSPSPIDPKTLQANLLNSDDFLKPTHFVNFRYLNIRKEPSIFSPVVVKIYQGEKVALFKRMNRDWCQVELPNQKVNGYAACRYLTSL